MFLLESKRKIFVITSDITSVIKRDINEVLSSFLYSCLEPSSGNFCVSLRVLEENFCVPLRVLEEMTLPFSLFSFLVIQSSLSLTLWL